VRSDRVLTLSVEEERTRNAEMAAFAGGADNITALCHRGSYISDTQMCCPLHSMLVYGSSCRPSASIIARLQLEPYCMACRGPHQAGRLRCISAHLCTRNWVVCSTCPAGGWVDTSADACSSLVIAVVAVFACVPHASRVMCLFCPGGRCVRCHPAGAVCLRILRPGAQRTHLHLVINQIWVGGHEA
jgi:hypothetical protein